MFIASRAQSSMLHVLAESKRAKELLLAVSPVEIHENWETGDQVQTWGSWIPMKRSDHIVNMGREYQIYHIGTPSARLQILLGVRLLGYNIAAW